MGNQLAGIAPSQILSVDNYLTDVTDYEYDSSLGSTRFFKVARAKFKEGLSVVKVFAIQDPSLPIKPHKDKVDDIKARLSNASNCLPFQRSTLSDKAALVFRQYVKSNLYDRISTRPFLNPVEKKWIAFQLLCALNQAHKAKVCHGDIKTENVMVTSWNWVLLTDFASFKPTYLPDNNPSDFNFFFDTSRRRTCYIAPERFVDVSSKQQDIDKGMPAVLESLPDSENIQKGEVTTAMDIFSTGCVIAELFTEGHPPFHLSTLLAYRNDMYTPEKIINKIEDPYIKALVEHMIQKDPTKRLSAEDYLLQWRGSAFPEYFYSFLKAYMSDFAALPILPPDEKIARVHKDMRIILENLCPTNEDGVNQIEKNSGLVIVISLITSSLRSLKFCIAKLAALDLMFTLAKFVPAEVVLDRLIPYMIHLVNDSFPRVRATALKTLTQSLALVKAVPRSDANIFPEYILPNLAHLTQDDVVAVRVAYAENIASLAETALHFLEITQLDHASKEEESDSILDPSVQYQGSYDAELQDLHEMIQQKVVTLLSDPENIVKQTLLENGITRLCVFFGRQKANDVLLSHMITFLNDKNDWHLRGSFFDNIVGVAAYVGWQSSSILKPLLQQGLSDVEEAVMCKTLNALSCLIELNLLQKPTTIELVTEAVPFLCHPNPWLRHDAVGFIAAISRSFNVADVHCNIIPLLQPYIKQPIIQVDQEVVLLSVLNEPVPRPVYDYILKSPLIDCLFDSLHDRQLIRNITRANHEPNYNHIEDSNLAQLFRKLHSQGMTESHEDKLLLLKEHMLKVHRSKSNISSTEAMSPEDEVAIQPGAINVSKISKVTRRHADMIKPKDMKSDNQSQGTSKKQSKKKATMESVMNEEWKSMFGGSSGSSDLGKPGQLSTKTYSRQQMQDTVSGQTQPLTQTQQQGTAQPPTKGLSPDAPITMSQLQAMESGSPLKKTFEVKHMENKPVQLQARFAGCKLELRKLVHKKREQYMHDAATKTLIEDAIFESKPPPPGWKPKGLLVAHLHEHKAAINRISVSHDHNFFATCSNDGSVKIWDCQRLEGKSIANRSRQTYNRQGGQIKTLTFFKSTYTIASASDDGSIHVFRIDPSTPRISLLQQRNSDQEEDGIVVDMHHMDSGSQNILTYATVYGSLIGWDLRAPSVAWKLKNEQKHGLITSYVVDHKQFWLGVGTSSGTHVCWDMRFQLPITTLTHPTGARVRKLLMHPLHQSWVISAVQGNNEVSMWDMETGARQMTLWASTTPPLSQPQPSSYAVTAMYCSPADGSPLLLTAGSDMRIRYWDLAYPQSSYIIAGAANDHLHQTAVSYKHRLVDGTEVIQETYSKQRGASSEDPPRRGPNPVPVGHRDGITDLTVFQSTQGFLATSSRDGVVKIWK
ncbi:phosphoinositide 3-kinase regulatory subunit 4-like [Glandiceps talaboti]